MTKDKHVNFILSEIRKKDKTFPTKGERMSYEMGILASMLADLCKRDSENYYIVKKKLEDLK